MAMLRIFTKNGGKVTAEHIRVSRSKTKRTKDHNTLKNGLEIYSRYAEKQANEALGECHDWSTFENVCQGSIMSGKLTGTTFILKATLKCSRSIPSLDSSQKILTRS